MAHCVLPEPLIQIIQELACLGGLSSEHRPSDKFYCHPCPRDLAGEATGSTCCTSSAWDALKCMCILRVPKPCDWFANVIVLHANMDLPAITSTHQYSPDLATWHHCCLLCISLWQRNRSHFPPSASIQVQAQSASGYITISHHSLNGTSHGAIWAMTANCILWAALAASHPSIIGAQVVLVERAAYPRTPPPRSSTSSP